jgi:hypothetical protein
MRPASSPILRGVRHLCGLTLLVRCGGTPTWLVLLRETGSNAGNYQNDFRLPVPRFTNLIRASARGLAQLAAGQPGA